MNKTQMRIYKLLDNYLHYCKANGYVDFKTWCKEYDCTIEDKNFIDRISEEVNYIADKLFE